MQVFIHKVTLSLLVAAGLCVAQSAFANGGTIPLRLGNGGTIPLRMSGNAQPMNGGATVQAQMTITRVTQDEMSPGQGALLVCQMTGENVSKHAAQGSVALAGGNYAVRGICYNHDTAAMEVVAERGSGPATERSFMTGPLLVEEPRSFAGRLTVNGTAPARYNFDLRCPEGRRDDGHYEIRGE